MAVGYDGVLFSVYLDDDGYLPLPFTADNENAPSEYVADVRMQSSADVATLAGKRSIVTVVPAIGMVSGGSLAVESGPGVRTLIYPTANGSTVTVDAILVSHAPIGHITATEYRVSLRFLLA